MKELIEKFGSVYPDIKDIASLYLEKDKYFLQIDKEKLSKHLMLNRPAVYSTPYIRDIWVKPVKSMIEVYHFSNKEVQHQLILASMYAIKHENDMISFSLIFRENRLSRLTFFNPEWNEMLEQVFHDILGSDKAKEFLFNDKKKGMGILSL